MNQIIFHSVSARPALYTNTSSVGRSLTPGPLAPRAPDVSCATLRPRLRRSDFPPPLRDDAPLAHLSSGVSMVIWWSGLRGGVAFALASAIFAHRDFDQHCGGLARDAVGASHYHGWSRHCSEGPRTKHSMTDGLAILQVTLLIATCSIFFLGGTIKRVSEACGVVKGHRDGDALVLVRPADRPLVKRPSRTRLLVPTAAVPTDEGL